MRRVYAIWLTRKLLSPMVLKSLIIIVFLQQIGQKVWVAKVFENAPSTVELSSFVNFYASALYNTTLAVQIFSVGIIVLLVWLFEDIFYKKGRSSFI